VDKRLGTIRRERVSAKKRSSGSGNNVVQLPVSKAKRPRDSLKQADKGIEYTNRKGKTYCLHVGTTKKGNPRYHFSMETSGELVKEIPEGYEVYENPNAQVFLRKIQPKEILDEEIAVLEKELRVHAKPTKYMIDVRGKVITIFWADQSAPEKGELSSFFGHASVLELYERNVYFTPVFRFILVDQQERLFIAARFCFRGSIDDWMHLAGGCLDPLETLATRYVEHLGKESFYELI
jgi:hypothetical protein